MYFSARYNERTPQRVATALGEQVHRLITIRGFYTEHAGDRVKQVIMTRLVAGSSSKTINVNVPVVCELGRQPPDHRDFELLPGRNCIRHPVQVQTFLTQRFAVVGHIHQRNVVLVALRLQECNQLRQDVIGVAQRVVVRIEVMFASSYAPSLTSIFGG